MISGDAYHDPRWAIGRDPERVALALHDQNRDGDGIELAEPALVRIVAAAGWMDRERQAEDRARAGLRGRSARDASSCGASAEDQRQSGELAVTKLRGDRKPRGVELRRRRLTSAAGDAIWLLHQHRRQAGVIRGLSRRVEIRCSDPTARAVTEHQGPGRILDREQARSRATVRCVELENRTSLLAAGCLP